MAWTFVMEDVPVGCATCRFSFELHCDALVARQSLFCVDGCVSELFRFILGFFFLVFFPLHCSHSSSYSPVYQYHFCNSVSCFCWRWVDIHTFSCWTQALKMSKNNSEVVEHKGNQIVHIRGDSDSELQALFDSVLKPDAQRPLQLPFRLRNLPDSFFKPPSTGSKSPSVASNSHSRENSTDSGHFALNGTPPASIIHHSRAHSSPASLQQTFTAGQQRAQHQHLKQQSCDLTLEHFPLPEGWEQAKTPQGQVYFLK